MSVTYQARSTTAGRISLAVGALLVAVAAAVGAQGQGQGAPGAAPGGGRGQGGGRGAAATSPAKLDEASAAKALAAVESAARAASAAVGIAVVDANGDLVLVKRLDGASSRGVLSAQGKARAAILFGVPTKVLADAIAAGTAVSAKLTPAGAGPNELVLNQGGIPLVRNGELVGAIGVGGSSSANDEAFARAGVTALGW